MNINLDAIGLEKGDYLQVLEALPDEYKRERFKAKGQYIMNDASASILAVARVLHRKGWKSMDRYTTEKVDQRVLEVYKGVYPHVHSMQTTTQVALLTYLVLYGDSDDATELLKEACVEAGLPHGSGINALRRLVSKLDPEFEDQPTEFFFAY